MSELDLMLTTTDNPYDPFIEFDQWHAYDSRMQYHTLALLARLCYWSDDLSEHQQKLAYNDAVLRAFALPAVCEYKIVKR